MRKNFSVNMVMALSCMTSQLVRAEMPRECFFATDMYGPYDPDSELVSDLPWLIVGFSPQMRLKSILAYTDDSVGENNLTGLQTKLEKKGKNRLELPYVIGTQVDEWSSRKVKFDDDS